ncbi:MAG: hypothetical protein ACOYIK_03340 [Coriobacteriales bacterium]|jgi:hypothetical protein
MNKVCKVIGIALVSVFLCFSLAGCGGSSIETSSYYTSPNGFTRAYGTDNYPEDAFTESNTYGFFALNDAEDYGAFITIGTSKEYSACFMGNVTKSEESGNRVYTIDDTENAIELTVTVTGMSDDQCTGWTGTDDSTAQVFDMEAISVKDFDDMAAAIQSGNYDFTNPLE